MVSFLALNLCKYIIHAGSSKMWKTLDIFLILFVRFFSLFAIVLKLYLTVIDILSQFLILRQWSGESYYE